MGDKKEFESKIRDDGNIDSGFLSGPLSEQLLSEDLISRTIDSDSKNVVSDDDYIEYQCDSGLDLSEQLSGVLHISTITAQSTQPSINLEEKSQDVPPLGILFQQDDDGDTQLHIAAVHGCAKSIGILIRVCPNKSLLDVPNDFGHTALHLAVMSGHDVVSRMLVIAGASLAVRDLTGETPLHKATLTQNVRCLQALLAPLPEHMPRRLSSVLNQKNYNGQACVHLAAFSGHIETLQTLCYYGADINASEGLAGWTPLHIAARRNDARLVQFLKDRATADVAARDYAGRSPRRLAKNAQIARTLATSDTSDDETDSEDDYDSDSEVHFEKVRESLNLINVV